MREASRINDAVNEAAKHYIKAGMTEREVAEFIDAQYRAHGCEGPSFTTIVSFGANAADPHHEPDDTVLKEGDCVLFDMGCVLLQRHDPHLVLRPAHSKAGRRARSGAPRE